MKVKRLGIFIFSLLLLFSFLVSIFPQDTHSEGRGKLVYYIPVEQAVERGLAAFMERSINTALEEGADHIVFEINTPGGAVDAAGEISTLIKNTPVPTTAFVVSEA